MRHTSDSLPGKHQPHRKQSIRKPMKAQTLAQIILQTDYSCQQQHTKKTWTSK